MSKIEIECFQLHVCFKAQILEDMKRSKTFSTYKHVKRSDSSEAKINLVLAKSVPKQVARGYTSINKYDRNILESVRINNS